MLLLKNRLCVKVNQIGRGSGFHLAYQAKSSSCQQSVHLTLGILRQSQAVSYASAFFQLDGAPPPAPAQVTQTVRWLVMNFRTRILNLYKTN